MVNGAAIGGGCGLATVMDLAITHADAKLGFPEVDLGVCPAVVAPWLVNKIGAGPARAILLRGGSMTGRQAGEVGIVDEVVESGADLAVAAAGIATRLSKGGGEAIAATKRVLADLDGERLSEGVRRGAIVSAEVLSAPEVRASLEARFGG